MIEVYDNLTALSAIGKLQLGWIPRKSVKFSSKYTKGSCGSPKSIHPIQNYPKFLSVLSLRGARRTTKQSPPGWGRLIRLRLAMTIRVRITRIIYTKPFRKALSPSHLKVTAHQVEIYPSHYSKSKPKRGKEIEKLRQMSEHFNLC